MKNVIVTGADQGLGINLVSQHLALGDRVFAVDRKITGEIEKLKEQYPESLCLYKCDVGQTEEVARAMKSIGEITDKIDVIYNNAAVYVMADEKVGLLDMDLDAIPEKVNVNTVGPMRMVQEALKNNLLKEGATICNTSSEAASLAEPVVTRTVEYAYCITKAGLNRAATIMQNELSKKGMRVICMQPGWMKTEMGGPDARVDPADTARGFIKITSDFNSSSRDNMYLWYHGEPLPW